VSGGCAKIIERHLVALGLDRLRHHSCCFYPVGAMDKPRSGR
jgi:hypothetical protein